MTMKTAHGGHEGLALVFKISLPVLPQVSGSQTCTNTGCCCKHLYPFSQARGNPRLLLPQIWGSEHCEQQPRLVRAAQQLRRCNARTWAREPDSSPSVCPSVPLRSQWSCCSLRQSVASRTLMSTWLAIKGPNAALPQATQQLAGTKAKS